MLKTDLYNPEGKIIGETKLPEAIFGVIVKPQILSQAVKVYLANQRQGTVSTKTRGEVSGGGKKPWRQKGTGHARQGSTRAPHWRGGGIVFGPKPGNKDLVLPKKMRRLALFGALTSKFNDGEIRVVDGLENIEPKTKIIKTLLNGLARDKKVSFDKTLMILPQKIKNVELAARNINGLEYLPAYRLNTYEILNNKGIILMQNAIKTIEETFIRGKGEEKPASDKDKKEEEPGKIAKPKTIRTNSKKLKPAIN